MEERRSDGATSRLGKKRVGIGIEYDGECTPEYHVASRRMRKVCQRPRGFGGNSGTGFVFQVTPDVAAINDSMRVVVVGVEFEGGWSQQRHWKGRGAGQVSGRPGRVGESRFVSDVLKMEEDE